MVKYITILGYFILICCICVAGILIYVSFSENALEGLFFLVPIYIVSHYTLLTLKGRNNIDLADNKVLNLIAYLNIGFFVFILVLPSLFAYNYYEKVKNISKLRTFNEINLYGDKISVDAKYSDNHIKYKVNVTYSKPKRVDNKAYTIIFKDDDGFEISKKEIDDFTHISSDGNLKNGLSANVSEYLSLDEYLLINNIDVAVRDK